MGINDLEALFPRILTKEDATRGRILVVTGPRNAGKTRGCQQLAETLKDLGWQVRGVLSLGRFVQTVKTGFYALDLANGERHVLASQITGELKGIHLGPWTFDDQVIAWGNHMIEAALPTDFLFIDELGYLEFNMAQGWNAAFPVLRSQAYRLAIVVIRPECLAAFSALGFSFQTIEITPKSV